MASTIIEFFLLYRADIAIAIFSAILGASLPFLIRLALAVLISWRKRQKIGFVEGIYFVYRRNPDSKRTIESVLQIKRSIFTDYKFTYTVRNSNMPPLRGTGSFVNGLVVLKHLRRYDDFLLIFRAWSSSQRHFIDLAVYCGLRSVGKVPIAGIMLISSKKVERETAARILESNSGFLLSGVDFESRRQLVRSYFPEANVTFVENV